ncbi:MAG: PIG-L deacetylase family protein [Ignavibacteria bacterium]|jgi:LmbE family N-acetylglucosaminyl deacetylase
MDKNTILVLAPHTDDGELGCGATIKKFIKAGKGVFYVAFSLCEESVPEGFPKDILGLEVKKATEVLGIPSSNLIIKNYRVRHFPSNRQEILEDLVKLNKQIKPDLIFSPSSFDVHQDHSTIFEEARRAFKNSSILGYEFMWNNFSFGSTLFSVVKEDEIMTKIKALDEYKSQSKRFYAKDKLIRGLANYRGLQISVEYAEAFEVIRWII